MQVCFFLTSDVDQADSEESCGEPIDGNQKFCATHVEVVRILRAQKRGRKTQSANTDSKSDEEFEVRIAARVANSLRRDMAEMRQLVASLKQAVTATLAPSPKTRSAAIGEAKVEIALHLPEFDGD